MESLVDHLFETMPKPMFNPYCGICGMSSMSCFEGRALNESSSLAPALGATKLTHVKDMVLVL
jgi:hypothetical protein